MKDGGGILPDIIIDPGKYGMIIASLLRERLFFDYDFLKAYKLKNHQD